MVWLISHKGKKMTLVPARKNLVVAVVLFYKIPASPIARVWSFAQTKEKKTR